MAYSLRRPPNHRIFLTAICVLASAPVLKLLDVQILEIVLLANAAGLFLLFIFRGFRLTLNRIWLPPTICYVFFFFITLLLAFASLRFRFYPPPAATSLLKQPLMISIVRIIELSLGAIGMIYIANILRNNAADRIYALKVYYWTGFASACFAILSIPLYFAAGIGLGVYFPNLRARGFFNEGGPYGLYLISIIVIGIFLYRLGKLSKTQLFFSIGILVPVFFMAQAKAAILACFALFLLNVFVVGSLRLKVGLVLAASVFAAVVLVFSDFKQNFMGYVQGYMLVQEIGVNVDESAYGGFGGRLAGAILVPRMILAHPLTGIGIGNYPLVFNDPSYLEGLPPTTKWESQSIGIIGYIAELGVPLFVALLLVLCVPAVMIYRRKAPPIVFILAVVQPMVHIFGVQLNFYYPWICSGFALSFIEAQSRPPTILE